MKEYLKKVTGFTLVELMVVIVIVGILATVAIPKFLDASNKAKASEFPTQLAAVYTGEMAYCAEYGTYAASIPFLVSGSVVDVISSSKWFSYSLAGGASSFMGTATVRVAFGAANTGDNATIDQANNKSCSNSLKRYVGSWR
jgi:prepilin-type N-terminal cleavage/methylation domain-containing protein